MIEADGKLKTALGKIPGSVWAMLLGVIVCLLVVGGSAIVPTHTSWMMGTEDTAQHYLGWQFFRHTPWLQWPLGANPNYGMEVGSSIVFTDSLPLFALVFKYLGPILPEPFQYTGLWILLCFVLQGFFAFKILSLLTKDKLASMAGSAFFLIAPIMIWRVGGHNSSVGQWAVLAALYFYLRGNYSFRHWLLLLSAIVLLNTYLFIMVFALFTVDLLQRRIMSQASLPKIAVHWFGALSLMFFLMWAIGFFMVGGKGFDSGGFGVFRMNVLSPVDPGLDTHNICSRILPDIRGGNGDYEGFNFLGIGMILIGFVAVFPFFKRPRVFFRMRLLPLALLCLAFFVFAISNHVAVGTHELFSYEMPALISFFANSARCSGRMFWPVFYLIYLAVFFLLFNGYRRGWMLTLCVLMFALQIWDSRGLWKVVDKRFVTYTRWESPLRSDVWNEIGARYKKILCVVPDITASDPKWLPLGELAASHGMKINSGYFSRASKKRLDESRTRMIQSIMCDEIEGDALYVFNDDVAWKYVQGSFKHSGRCVILDGFRIMLPNFEKDIPQTVLSSVPEKADSTIDFNYETEEISFKKGGNSSRYVCGWSEPEPWGTWSKGSMAYVMLRLVKIPDRDVSIVLDGVPFVKKSWPEQDVVIYANNEAVGEYKLRDAADVRSMRVIVPRALIAGRDGFLSIRFAFKTPKSPASLNVNQDPRSLALGLTSLSIKPVE